jgi:hypothetical protein
MRESLVALNKAATVGTGTGVFRVIDMSGTLEEESRKLIIPSEHPTTVRDDE